jgi:exonuclease VII large subunit
LLDPHRLLARGWSITRSREGTLVTSPDAVTPGSVLRTTVAGGDINSVVTEEMVATEEMNDE